MQWCGLLLLSVLLGAIFEAFAVPAALLLGPMVAAIALAIGGTRMLVRRPAFIAAQGVLGCLMARGIPGSIITTLTHHWAAFAIGMTSVGVLASALGWVLARWSLLPGETAFWGVAPGAASAMVIMAEDRDADVRTVALMQYLRVVCVTFSASLFTHWWLQGSTAAVSHMALMEVILLAPGSWSALAATLLVAFGGAAIGARLPLPAGGLLVPLVLGVGLQDLLHIRLELPPLLLAAAYALIGWTVGARFDRQALTAAARTLPTLLASVLALILLCGLVALGLVHWAHVDPVTAFLATSPGGADSVAIIAAASPNADIAFVVTMQVLRMLFVIFTGPAVARTLAAQVRCAAERRRAQTANSSR